MSSRPQRATRVDRSLGGQEGRSLCEALRVSGCAASPSVTIDEESLARVLSKSPASSATDPTALHLGDLYLVLCSLAQVPAATVILNERIKKWAEEAVRRVLPLRELGREVLERLLHEMLFATPPRIAQYTGRGALKNWVRVAAVRSALNAARDHRRADPLTDSILAERVAPGDPELAYAKSLYVSAFKKAFAQALAALPVSDRNLIRGYGLDGLTVRELGVMYATHASTISRRLADIRETLRTATRECLGAQLGLSSEEVTSVLALVMSEAGDSVRRMLGQS